MNARIIILRERILRDISKRWTVTEMANSIDLSESHFHKIFKAEIGISPVKYLRKLKV